MRFKLHSPKNDFIKQIKNICVKKLISLVLFLMQTAKHWKN